ncbi:MAG: hypothetical protein LBL36_02685, partial [Clostridiales Family XIII bacterium]|nr:hypothetical protein [Clostridiales Family XIII bacterium]
ALDLTGLQVTATLSGGGAGVITGGYTTSPANGAVLTESTTVTVAYQSQTTTFDVTVSEGYALSVTAGKNGSVSTSGGSRVAGTAVSVTATPDYGYKFTGWTASGLALTDKTANPLTFTMPAGAVTLAAGFEFVGAPVPWGVDYDAGYGGVIFGADGGQCLVLATQPNYVIEAITVDGKRLDGVQNLKEFTTTVAPKRSIFATFSYKAPAYVPDPAPPADDEDPADPADPVDPADPSDSVDPADPTDPTSPADDTPVTESGWVQNETGAWEYLTDGEAETGWLYDTNYKAWYYLAESGAMQTGWVKDGSTWYYFTTSGTMKTGWVKDKNAWYYLAGNGAMVAGKWLKDTDGSWYYLSGNGKMLTGKQSIGGKTYTFKANGVWVS